MFNQFKKKKGGDMMRVFAPEKRLVAAAPKDESFEITRLEIRDQCLVIHTGSEYEDEVPVLSRLAICSKDKGKQGNQQPLFYPDRCSVVLENEQASAAWTKMMARAVKEAGLLDQVSGEARGVIFSSLNGLPQATA
ncbi:MAG: hypothetical protein GF365_00530 [Candidatus Buchananbacteria bacterium]|nr:hypothetical protein [Candidatus Buchananbacteria bacterium]